MVVSEMYLAHCMLLDSEPDEDDHAAQRNPITVGVGTTISSAFDGRDENNAPACFLTFPYLLAQTSGTYRLKFHLSILDSINKEVRVVASFKSKAFQVYDGHAWPGAISITPLTRSLQGQGCRILN